MYNAPIPPKSPSLIPFSWYQRRNAPTVVAVQGNAGQLNQSFSFSHESLTNTSIILSPPNKSSLTTVIKKSKPCETALVNSLKAAFSSYISKTGSQTFNGNHSYKALKITLLIANGIPLRTDGSLHK